MQRKLLDNSFALTRQILFCQSQKIFLHTDTWTWMESLPAYKYKVLAVTGSITGFVLLCVFPWLFGLIIRVAQRQTDLSFAQSWQDGFNLCTFFYVVVVICWILTMLFHYYNRSCSNYDCRNGYRTCCHRCRNYHLIGSSSPSSTSSVSSTDQQHLEEANDLFIPEEAYRSNQLV